MKRLALALALLAISCRPAPSETAEESARVYLPLVARGAIQQMSWPEADYAIKDCQVATLLLQHSGDVYLYFNQGGQGASHEPYLNAAFEAAEAARELGCVIRVMSE